MPNETELPGRGAPPAADAISRREAVRRVAFLMGGAAFVGGTGLLAACERGDRPAAVADGKYQKVGDFSAEQVAMLDEIADTILPTTAKSPGAKAAGTGPFMALMVTDTYREPQQKAFRDGFDKIDEATKKAAGGKTFMEATPAQRLAVLTQFDREAKTYMDARAKAQSEAAKRGKQAQAGPQAPPEGTSAQVIAGKAANDSADKNLSDQRQENASTGDAGGAAAITADAPPHFFRMMKELSLLGFFTSEIGYTKAMRYVESPGRYDGNVAYKKGDPSWAPHA